jgi:hypothetical protein
MQEKLVNDLEDHTYKTYKSLADLTGIVDKNHATWVEKLDEVHTHLHKLDDHITSGLSEVCFCMGAEGRWVRHVLLGCCWMCVIPGSGAHGKGAGGEMVFK